MYTNVQGKAIRILMFLSLFEFSHVAYPQTPPKKGPESTAAEQAMQRALAMGKTCDSPYTSTEDGFMACFPQPPELKRLTIASGEGRVYSLAYDDKGCSYHYLLTTSPVLLEDSLLKKQQAKQFYLEGLVRSLAQEAGVAKGGISLKAFLFAGKYDAIKYEFKDNSDPSSEPIVTKGLLIMRNRRLYDVSIGTNCGARIEAIDRLDAFLGVFALT